MEQSLFPRDPRAALFEGSQILGVPISTHVAARMLLYIGEVVRWNTKMNLTATEDEVEITIRHVLDSLAAFKVFEARSGLRILDVGSGAGFPGLVWKLQAPGVTITLLEPTSKKVAFLHHMCGMLGISGLEIIMKRVQDLQEEKLYQVISSRALKTDLLLTAVPRLLAPGGRVLLYRVTPLAEDSPAFCIDRQYSFQLPFLNIPRTISLLRLRHDTSPSVLPKPLAIL